MANFLKQPIKIRQGLSDKWKLILTPDEDKPEDAFISGIFGHFFSLSGNKHRLSGQPLFHIVDEIAYERYFLMIRSSLRIRFSPQISADWPSFLAALKAFSTSIWP